MKEFELTLRLRNNLLKRRRLELGLTPRQVAEKIPMSYGLYLQYEGLKTSPLTVRGEWRESSLRLAAFHGIAPEDLWPDTVLAVNKPEVTAEVAADTALRLAGYAQSFELPPTPEELLLAAENDDALKEAVSQLDGVRREVIEQRLAGKTYKEIGEHYGLSVERMRQIHLEALQGVEVAAHRSAVDERMAEVRGTTAHPVACPVCGALPGRRCVSKKGHWRAPHPERLVVVGVSPSGVFDIEE